MDLHNVTVTACRGAFSRDVYQVNLGDWLSAKHFLNPNKKAIDAIMPHGWFNQRTGTSIIRHSGLVQIDIDHKSNDWEDWDGIVEHLGSLDSVAYAAISCSGQGAFCLVNCFEDPNADALLHAHCADEALAYIEKSLPFLELDEKVSRNLASLRFAPFNPSRSHWNLNTTPLIK